MYEIPVRLSPDSASDRRARFWSDRRFRNHEWRMRPRVRRSRRYLFYAALAIGVCALLAFVGCGASNGVGELKVSQSAIDFGAVALGRTSTAAVLLTNSGTGAVQLSNIVVTGPFVLAGAGSLPRSIAPGATYSFDVQFTPSSAGSAAGQVTVASNITTGGPTTVSLSGLGVSVAAPPTSAVLSGISCSSSSMVGAGADNCFVALNAPAGGNGVTVSLSSSNPAIIVPATVTVPANTTGTGFVANASAVSSTQTGILTASEGGVSESFAVELDAALRTLSASTTQISFGFVATNTSAAQSVVLTSSGTEAVTIDSTSVTGAGFSVPGLALPVALAPGQVLIMNVQFAPVSAGSAAGQLTLTTDNSSGQPIQIGLSGTGAESGGAGGSAAATPGVSSLTCSHASMTGAGVDNCNLTLSAAAPTGGLTVSVASSANAVAVPGSVTVPPGAVSAAFTATAAAVTSSEAATLTATANGSSQSFTLQLNAASVLLSPSPSIVSFGNVSLSALSMQTLTLASTGTEPVTITSAALTGTGFTMTGISTPLTLNPGQSVTVTLEFVPTVAGATSGQLTIATNGTTGGSLVIGLSGTGATPYEVNLTWSAPASSADAVAGYKIYRSLSGTSSYQLVNSGIDTTPKFTDTTVTSGQAYVYYVTSVDGSGVESVPSNAFDVAIP